MKILSLVTSFLAAAVVAAMAFAPRPAGGQDMPLRDFAPDGETWKLLGAGRPPASGFAVTFGGFGTPFGGIGGNAFNGGFGGGFAGMGFTGAPANRGFGGNGFAGTGSGFTGGIGGAGFGGNPPAPGLFGGGGFGGMAGTFGGTPAGFGGFTGYHHRQLLPGAGFAGLPEAGGLTDGWPARYDVTLAGKGYSILAPHDNPPAAAVLAPGGDTLYVAVTKPDTHLWAYAVGNATDAIPVPGHRYAQLRPAAGSGKATVASLTADAAGRIYAGTADGVQVFDPTGRLSGVFPLPAKGTVDRLVWEGEKNEFLVAWTGGLKYVRRMATVGVKGK